MKVFGAGTLSIENIQEFGIDVLRKSLTNVFLFYTSCNIPVTQQREVMDSVIFVNGSGLDIAFQTFGLNVDPSNFRETFYDFCTYQYRLKNGNS